MNDCFRKCIAIHLKDNQDKFNFLALGVRKLVSFVTGECAPESLDSPSNMEVLTSGHLFALVIKVICLVIPSFSCSISCSNLQE